MTHLRLQIPAWALNEFGRAPDCRPARKENMLASLGSIANTLGYVTVEEAETFTDYLLRVGWAQEVGQAGVEITPLGTGVLRASEQQHRDVGNAGLEVVIDPENAFAYTTVWNALNDQGPGLLVDPYLRFEQLEDLHAYGAATRLLTSPKAFPHSANKALYARALAAFDGNLEVRYSGDLHDRYYIADNGAVLMLGISLNGIGRKISVLTTLSPRAAEAIRALVEEQWNDAEVLEAKESSPALDVPSSSTSTTKTPE